MKRNWVVLIALLASALVSGLSACAGSDGKARHEYALAPESALPDFVQDAAPQVREAYRFAIANPDVLSAFPCYCGCGAMGHQSNLDCYIKEIQPDGSIEFENHAFGWSLCIDITRDVMRLLGEGKELKEIRAYIDAQYSQYGPPTDTAPIP